MSKLLLLLISILLLSVISSNPDSNSRNFFKGLISQGLHNPNWNSSIINYVNSSNFNIESLRNSSSILLRNGKYHSTIGNVEAISEITIQFNNILNALFPIFSFSLRFEGIRRLVLPRDAPVFNILNQTFYLYAKEQNVSELLRKNEQIEVLDEIELAFSKEDFFSAGRSFQILTENILGRNARLISFHIGIGHLNESKLSEENYQSQELAVGMIVGLGVTERNTQDVLLNVNSTIFDQHVILNGFNILSKNSFDFIKNPKDQEIFVETVGEISLYLRNLKKIVEECDNKELIGKLNIVFNLFESHQNLLKSIQSLLLQKIDIRKYFKIIYDFGEVNGNYKEAGIMLAKSCEILLIKN